MGKLIVTNRQEWADTLSMCAKNTGFSSNGLFSHGMYLETFSKLNVETTNYFQAGEDFVACAGTLIYKSLMGKDALESVYEDAKKYSVNELRVNMIGTYVVVYKIGSIVNVFVDEVGTYSLYYYNQPGRYLITNTYYHVEKCVQEKLNELGFLEQIFENCIINQETMFQNLYRLAGEELISINLETGEFLISVIGTNSYSLQCNSFEEVVEKLVETFLTYAKRSNIIPMQPVRFCTGGVDSRVYLALDLAVGKRPIISCWEGGSIDMNSKIQDMIIAKEIASEMELDFVPYNVEHDFISDMRNIDGNEYERYGEYATLYGNNKNWFDIFAGGKSIGYASFGYFGETLKSWESLDAREAEWMSIDEYITMYEGRHAINNPEGSFPRYNEYYAFVGNKVRRLAERDNMNLQKLSKKDCMKLYYYYRLHADTLMSNLVNMFSYSFDLFAQKELADYINQIPYEYKMNDKLNLAITDRLYPELVAIRYYTHGRYMNLNRKEMELIPTTTNKTRAVISKVLKRNPICKKILQYRWDVKHQKQNEKEKEQYIEEIYKNRIIDRMGIVLDSSSFKYFPVYVDFLYKSKMVNLLLDNYK